MKVLDVACETGERGKMSATGVSHRSNLIWIEAIFRRIFSQESDSRKHVLNLRGEEGAVGIPTDGLRRGPTVVDRCYSDAICQ
jgi:hypothetical protein